MADDMEKNRRQDHPGQQGGKSRSQQASPSGEQGERGQSGQQRGETRQKKGGQGQE